MLNLPFEQSIVLQQGTGFREELLVSVQKAHSWEENGGRFEAGDQVAKISWRSSVPDRGGQMSTLQPVTAEELKKFGLMCIEISARMGQ